MSVTCRRVRRDRGPRQGLRLQYDRKLPSHAPRRLHQRLAQQKDRDRLRERGTRPAVGPPLAQGRFDLMQADSERACRIIAALKPDKGSEPSPEEYRRQRADHGAMIANRDFWFRVDRYGRVHTPLTALEEELRCCLSANGEPLVGIDLKNSQPLMLGIVERQLLTSRHRMAVARQIRKTSS